MFTEEELAACYFVLHVLELTTNKVAKKVTFDFSKIYEIVKLQTKEDETALKVFRDKLVHNPTDYDSINESMHALSIKSILSQCCTYLDLEYTTDDIKEWCDVLRKFYKENTEV